MQIDTAEAAYTEVQKLLTFAAIGRACGLSRNAPRLWQTVPEEHAPALEQATHGRITCEQMCPDLEWERDSSGRVVAYRRRIEGASRHAA